MDKRIAQKVGRVVNDPLFMEFFNLLIQERIEHHRRVLETIDDQADYNRSQGSIRELRYLSNIRERVKDRAQE